jgi:uncharacterized protein Yka (UPF0111/DUF47 family)
VPATAGPEGVESLNALAEVVVRSTREYVRCLECARELPREPSRSDIEEVLVAVHHLLELEHESDGIERGVEAKLLSVCGDFRELHVLSAVAHGLEEAADALARCSLIVRDYVLSGVLVAA